MLALPSYLFRLRFSVKFKEGSSGQGHQGPGGGGTAAELQEEESLPGGDCTMRRCRSFFLLDRAPAPPHLPTFVGDLESEPPDGLWGRETEEPLKRTLLLSQAFPELSPKLASSHPQLLCPLII